MYVNIVNKNTGAYIRTILESERETAWLWPYEKIEGEPPSKIERTILLGLHYGASHDWVRKRFLSYAGQMTEEEAKRIREQFHSRFWSELAPETCKEGFIISRTGRKRFISPK